MAVTAAFSLYTASPPSRAPFTGNVKLTNGGASDVTLVAIDILPPTPAKVGTTPVQTDAPIAAPGANVGGGTGLAGASIAASNGTLSIPFTGIAVGGTWSCVAYFSDGSNCTATVALTPV